MWYYVEYNGRCLKAKKSLQPCLEFIKNEGLREDFDNHIILCDSHGDMYNPFTGALLYPWEYSL